jgi:putative transposase
MRLMGIEAIYPKPHTSRPHPEHKIYPYLLRDLRIDHANQVWATDITYVPMARGFMYLVAVMDWHSRKILSWRLSNTLAQISVIKPSRKPWIVMENLRSSTPTKEHSSPATGSLKSSRTTGSPSVWTAAADARTTSSLNGCGGPSNTIKHNYLYLHSFGCGSEFRHGLEQWIRFYNYERGHSSLDDRTPDEVYYGLPHPFAEAA